jgi:hypothetical protein
MARHISGPDRSSGQGHSHVMPRGMADLTRPYPVPQRREAEPAPVPEPGREPDLSTGAWICVAVGGVLTGLFYICMVLNGWALNVLLVSAGIALGGLVIGGIVVAAGGRDPR